MFCSTCGTELPDEANFCWKCGQPVKESVSRAVPAQYEFCEIGGGGIDTNASGACRPGLVTLRSPGLARLNGLAGYIRSVRRIMNSIALRTKQFVSLLQSL